MAEASDFPFDVEQINRLLHERRSMQPVQFAPGRIIPDEIIQQLLENANWAPTHKRTEPWRFVVFSGAGLQKLATFQSETYKQHAGEKFQQAKYEKLAQMPLLSSHAIAIGLKRTDEVPEIEEVEAVACAVQNLHLTATAYGLAGFWGSGGVTYVEDAKPFFGLAPTDRLLGIFWLGYPKEGATARSTRKPIAEKVTWVTE
ncbi:nitroreductase family protein [Hymenobacter profundi]|uniref:Putative NAD(P)H nitroreductase n=1 Tax=Hymenobacter profundi TaxID=1982110 RepID=A0ABS6WWX1_9BACT|nr:nitroreductase [Hymenobacter profundi]MBW3128080.1 nitroreductase [Hymenobacter profundi]